MTPTLRPDRSAPSARALVVPVVLALALAACAPPPGGSSTGGSPTPPSCPLIDVVTVDGDSLAAGMAAQLTVPGRTTFSAAAGGTSYTQIGVRETIDDRVLRWLDQCGTPDALVIEGGINDLLNGVALEDLTAQVAALRAELAARDVDTFWVTIPPLAQPRGPAAIDPARRAYNDWLRSAEGAGADVVDVVPAMQDPAKPDTLAPAYWWYRTDLFTPDGLHPNEAGYRTMATVVADAVQQRLGG